MAGMQERVCIRAGNVAENTWGRCILGSDTGYVHGVAECEEQWIHE